MAVAPDPAQASLSPACDPHQEDIRRGEQILRVDEIQGNVLPGFNKDFQAFLFLQLANPDGDLANVRRWIRMMIPFIATARQVLAFKQLYKMIHDQEKDTKAPPGKPRTIQATWMNIAFSHRAVELLTGDAAGFESAFVEGMADRSKLLGDPQDGGMEGAPENWVVGSSKNPADIVLLIGSDDRDDLLAQVAWVENTIYSPRALEGDWRGCGLRLVYKQLAAVLPDPDSKNEHFGFRDGISQPGVRGRLSETTLDDYLTPSETCDWEKGKPGQDLVWTGEFVFDYFRQLGADGGSVVDRTEENYCPGPGWAADGSYLVIRRLRQDVPMFKKFFKVEAQRLGLEGLDELVASVVLQAKCVGRWPDGAPLIAPAAGATECSHRTQSQDGKPVVTRTIFGMAIPEPDLGGNDKRNNDFEFAELDADALACPFASHIRRMYTRDDASTALTAAGEAVTAEITTQTHRMLRRGIPFGEPFDEVRASEDSGDRGLMFVAYQSSIERQFEFVTQHLANNPTFRVTNGEGRLPPEEAPGYDMIIGQNGSSTSRERSFRLRLGGELKTLETEQEWVIPTGGGYFFAPSMTALKEHITASP